MVCLHHITCNMVGWMDYTKDHTMQCMLFNSMLASTVHKFLAKVLRASIDNTRMVLEQDRQVPVVP